MRTHAFTLMLRDDPQGVVEYRAAHAAVWPEVLAAFESCGVEDLQLFIRGRRLFMVLTTVDPVEPDEVFARLHAIPRYQAWDELMASFQDRAPEAGPDEWWAALEPLFAWHTSAASEGESP
jgi:L-rhamnose mutarotase